MDYLSKPFPAQNYEVIIDLLACSYIVDNIETVQMGGIYDENRPSGQKVVDCKSEPELLYNFFKSFKRIKGTTLGKKIDTYIQKEQNPRRMTTKTTSLQGIPRVLRHTICKETMYDLDIANCHPEILAQWCQKHGVVSTELQEDNRNRKERFVELQQVMGWTKQQSKDYKLKLLNGGGCGKTTREIQQKLADGTTWYCPLIAELELIRKHVVKIYPDLEKKAKKAKDSAYNIEGTTLSYLLTNLENQVLQVMVQACSKKGYKISSLIFDGLMLYKETVQDIQECCDYLQQEISLQTGYTFSVIEKEMDEGLKIPNDYLLKEDRKQKEKEEKEEKVIREKEEKEKQKQEKKNEKESLLEQKRLQKELEEEEKEQLMHERLLKRDKKEQERIEDEKQYQVWKTHFEQDHLKVIDVNKVLIKTDGEYAFRDYTDLRVALGHQENYHKNITRWYYDPEILVYNKCAILTHNQFVPKGVYNMWENPIAESYPTDGDTSLLYKHILDVISNGDIGVSNYLLDWMAQMLQYPESKTTMIVCVSKEGSGKDTWADLFRELLGHRAVLESPSAKVLFGDFNNGIMNKKLLIAEELSAKELTQYDGRIKTLVTNTMLSIEQKGKDSFSIESHHRLMLFTNKTDYPIQTSDDDRRKMIIRCSDSKIGDVEYFKTLRTEMAKKEVIGAFYKELMERDIQRFNNCKGKCYPETEYQKEIKSSYSNPVEEWLKFIILEEKYKDFQEYDGESEWVWSSSDCVSSFSSYCDLMKFRNFEVSGTQLGVRLYNLNLKGVSKKRMNKGMRYHFDVKLLNQTYPKLVE